MMLGLRLLGVESELMECERRPKMKNKRVSKATLDPEQQHCPFEVLLSGSRIVTHRKPTLDHQPVT